jgi:tRNA A37 methylthiotransferase MiaB
MALQQELTEEKLSGYYGSVLEVLIDAAHPRERGVMNGRTEGYRPISVYAPEVEIGDMVQVKVKSHKAHWLYGELVGR